MKSSQLFTKTQKLAKEFDSKNATLLTKAGFIDQVMSGVYSYLPLGLRVLNKIEKIVREEMDKIGNEVLLPAISPKENWQKTNRLEIDVLMQASAANENSRKKNNGEYILNPTHEDIVTPLVQQYVKSYKDLPVAVYQIQNKFRNEARPKSGILRGREFRMKDLYSFHESKEDLMEYYEVAKQAYLNVYERLGMAEQTFVALASGGDFTENYSHEFQTKCDIGEDEIFYDKQQDIYYNKEVTAAKAPEFAQDSEQKEREDVYGEGVVTVEKLVEFLKVPIEKCVKTLLYSAVVNESESEVHRILAVAIRGDREVDELKLAKVTGYKSLQLLGEQQLKELTGAEVGYAGLINLPESVEIYADDTLENMVNFEMGINKTHYHAINLNWERDLQKPDKFYDLKVAEAGDLNPETGEAYEVFAAAEVGNIFPLEVKFSKAFDFTYADENGEQNIVYMGSYGIGTTRIMGVIAEIMADDKGLVWPKQIAPCQVYLISIGADERAAEIYTQLQESGIEVLWDDRDERPGTKFNDADLYGIPVRVVVSSKTLEQDSVEVKLRSEDDAEMVKLDELEDWIQSSL